MVATAGEVCRESVHASCDVTEACNGISADCPEDELYADGTICESELGGDGIGACYAGECLVTDEYCAETYGNFFRIIRRWSYVIFVIHMIICGLPVMMMMMMMMKV